MHGKTKLRFWKATERERQKEKKEEKRMQKASVLKDNNEQNSTQEEINTENSSIQNWNIFKVIKMDKYSPIDTHSSR